jgi:hypothetical protein
VINNSSFGGNDINRVDEDESNFSNLYNAFTAGTGVGSLFILWWTFDVCATKWIELLT